MTPAKGTRQKKENIDMKKIALSLIAFAISSNSFAVALGGTEYTLGAAGTGMGVLLKTMGSGLVNKVVVNVSGLSSTAWIKANVGGTAATLKQGKAKRAFAGSTTYSTGPGAGVAEIVFEGLTVTALNTTSVYLECSDAAGSVVISTEGK